MVFQYTVESVDVDGDGAPDGDLVTKWRVKADGTRAVVARKFVPKAAVRAVVQKAVVASRKPSRGTPPRRQLRTYRGQTPPAAQAQQPVQVQDKTNFGQYVKMGAGVEIGRLGVDAVADALGDLF